MLWLYVKPYIGSLPFKEIYPIHKESAEVIKYNGKTGPSVNSNCGDYFQRQRTHSGSVDTL